VQSAPRFPPHPGRSPYPVHPRRNPSLRRRGPYPLAQRRVVLGP
jgi:hypothetical protein